MAGPFARTNSGLYVPSTGPGWTPPHYDDLSYWLPFTQDFEDAGPNSITATPVGVQIAPDPVGGGFNCYHGQGGSDRVDLTGYSADMFGDLAVTYGGWIRATGWGGGGFGRINDNTSNSSAASKTFSNYINQASGNEGFIRLGYYHSLGGSAQIQSPNDSIILDAWTHIMYTSKPSQQRLYINGVLRGTENESYVVLGSSTAKINIGNRFDLIRGWEGQKRHYVCWKIVLTELEINDVMNGSAPT